MLRNWQKYHKLKTIFRDTLVDLFRDTLVEEYFIHFLEVDDKLGKRLFDLLRDTLVDLRGQGYDNDLNIKGKNEGMQKRLLDVNPITFYTPCGCHNLNLTLCNMVKLSEKAIDFFGIIQRG